MSAAEVAVGAVVLRDDELLLVRRGQGPAAGEWSIPGGRVEFGEELHEAVVREVAEETGIDVVVERFLGWVERIGREDGEAHHFVILDFLARPLDEAQGERAGDDAAEVAWVPLAGLDGYALVDGLLDFLMDVGILEATETVDLGVEPLT
jgi:8-oxo-dGTP diphosphatase